MMDDYTTEDLFNYCEKLKKKLARYETRFSALVDAYKQLVEEKQVLETTLKTLSSRPNIKSKAKDHDAHSNTDPLGLTTNGAHLNTDPLGLTTNLDDSTNSDTSVCMTKETIGVPNDDDNDDECSQEDMIHSLEEKISALSNALQSVTEGKTKMETAFQADKKAMMSEYKAKLAQYEVDTNKSISQEQEMKAKLCQEQIDRESEEKIHASMLKELQQLLAMEKLEKDELKIQICEKENILSSQSQKQCKEHESQISEITEELRAVKEQLASTREENKKPNNIIRGLTDEVEKIKVEHANNIVVEQRRANNAEDILKSRQQHEEERIAELESRLSELSEIVGNYDKQRQEDQSVIRKLRERLENLDVENSALASTQNTLSHNDGKIAELQDQIIKLKNILKMTWKKADNNIDILLSNSEIDDILKNDPAHLACQAEYKQLKDEFQCYKRKQKAKSPLKDDKVSDEVSDYKRKIEKLEMDMKYLEEHYEEKERESLVLISRLQVDITCANDDLEIQVENVKEEHKKMLDQVESELHKQRTRTVALLSEKDLDIERLEKTVYEREECDQRLKHERSMSEKSSTSHHGDEPSMVEEMLVHSPTSSIGGGLFHYTQQLAHQETELSSCRSQIIDFESDVRDAEHREQQLLQQMQALKEEIRNLERGRSRESANLEYLKNVCLRYMLTYSTSVKKQMSLAISTILTFSPAEIAQIHKRQNSGWW